VHDLLVLTVLYHPVKVLILETLKLREYVLDLFASEVIGAGLVLAHVEVIFQLAVPHAFLGKPELC
jgi:hypothetical protein